MAGTNTAKKLLDDIKAERKRGAQIRLVTTIVVLLMIVFFGTRISGKIKNFDSNLLLNSLQDNAGRIVWPQVSRALDDISKHSLPIINEAFSKEIEALGPKLADRFEQEADTFQRNISQQMQQSLDAQLGSGC